MFHERVEELWLRGEHVLQEVPDSISQRDYRKQGVKKSFRIKKVDEDYSSATPGLEHMAVSAIAYGHKLINGHTANRYYDIGNEKQSLLAY